MLKTKVKYVVETLKDCKIEVFSFLLLFGIMVQASVTTQLMEDKLCLNKFGYSIDVCREIGSGNDSDSKSTVLKEVSLINGNKAFLSKIPQIITTLFLGSWITSYPEHLKFIMSIPCLSGITNLIVLSINTIWFKLDARYLYISDLLGWIFPSNSFIALQTYIVLTNPPNKRVLKFAALGVAIDIGMLLGEMTGGRVLALTPWFPNQFKNYLGIYAVAFMVKITAILWLIFQVPTVHKLNEKRIVKNPDHGTHNLPTRSQKKEDNQQKDKKSFLSNVLSIEALQNLGNILTKKREEGRRFVLWMMILAGFLFGIEMSCQMSINYQFNQRAYHWSNYEYSQYHALTNVFPAIAQIFGPRIFIQWLGIPDVDLAIIALLSQGTARLITGLWLSSTGYILATIIGSLSSMYNAASQSIYCNVIDPSEMGGLFSLTGVFTTFLTLFTDQVLIRVFNFFLDTWPGLPYILFSTFVLAPLSVMLYIKYKAPHLGGGKDEKTEEINKTDNFDPEKTSHKVEEADINGNNL